MLKKIRKTEKLSNFSIGVILIIIVYFLAAIMNAFAKVAVNTIPVGVILFFQNFFGLLFFAPFVLKKGIKGFHTKHIGLHFVRAVSGILSYGCLFIAIKNISLLDATLLGNAAPLFLPFVVWAWMGKKIHSLLWVSLIVGFLGVVFILHPDKGLFQSWMVLIALAASLFSAIALQSVANLKKHDSSMLIVFYYLLIATILMIPILIWQWNPLSLKEWALLIGIGFILGLTVFLIAEAYFYGTPAELGPFNYSIIVFAGVIQWIFWKQVPTLLGLLGITLVCLGGIFTILLQKRYQK